ncbi:hypothetical protein OEZ85_013787 [Tetradesmus obliquus]|uniref:Mini-chromosome maintenance complex-binding protein n=1 Tax=Tetradesmus obliquus TaxID=3088 RepID=A0ABY8U5X6_TETOB|nr:hypothetical protein OEZ85_013787 [Tetradesmus obliquus]
MNMQPSITDDLARPLHAIPGLLASYDGRNHNQLFNSVAAHFGKLGAPDHLQQVPILTHENAESIPANTLVRFRGMVADMFNPEFFVGAYRAPGGPWKPAALYTDAVPEDIDAAAESAIMERRPLLLTPVPHEQAWATAAWAGHPVEPPTPSASDRSKRAREPGSNDLLEPALLRSSNAAAVDKADAAASSKAPRIAGSSDTDKPFIEPDAHPTSVAHDRDQDQQRRQQQQQGTAAAAAVDEHAQQQPDFQPGDCIVQVYSDFDGFRLHDVVEVLGVMSVVPVYSDFDGFRLHDVVEVLGVMSVVPGLAALQQQQQQQQQQGGDVAGAAAAAAGVVAAGGDGMDVDDGGFWEQDVAALPPTSQVMRLHALAIRKLPPLTTTGSSSSTAAADLQQQQQPAALPRSLPGHLAAHLPLLRQRALALLAAPLAGDVLAAEYLLLAALGSVMNRGEAGEAMGLLPLNLTHVPSSGAGSKAPGLVPGLAAALRSLLPHVTLMPLDVPALNNKRWYPQQHAASGRLFRGCLQLTAGTLLLLDETALGPGQLGDAGVKNLQALRQVLTQQQLPCGCQVYTHNLSVNQPAVVLSSTRSVLRDSLALSLPLQPQRPVLVKPGQTGQTGQTGSFDQAGAPAAVVDWAAADVAGPEAVAAAAAAMPELAAVREYLAAARGLECRMDQAAAEGCVTRFRAMQQANPGIGMEDLNLIITVSKLLSVSLGHEQFSIDSWERAMQLEQLRKQRLAAAAAQQQAR